MGTWQIKKDLMQRNIDDLFFLKSRIGCYFAGQLLTVEIETERLYIHSYKDSDFENCLCLYGDESITKYFDHGKARSETEINELVHEKGKKYFSKGEPFGLFSIFSKKSNTFIGQIDLLPTDAPCIAEIGFILHQEYQNQGFCTEAVKAILFDYVEEINFRGPKCWGVPINKVIATVHPSNLSSKRVLQKIGMSFDKIQERFEKPRLWYSIPITLPTKIQRVKA